ncbi:MAG: hypothetical protein H6741_24965, partial [Alphaproteobacteria bacterium]|nr:hypothetical protein [Alphaproteobacteria bacterium]
NVSLAALRAWELGGPGEIPTAGLELLREAGWAYLVVDRGRFARELSDQLRGWETLGQRMGEPLIRSQGVTVYPVTALPEDSLSLPPVRWPEDLAPAGPRHPLDSTPWPEPLFEEIVEPGRPR